MGPTLTLPRLRGSGSPTSAGNSRSRARLSTSEAPSAALLRTIQAAEARRSASNSASLAWYNFSANILCFSVRNNDTRSCSPESRHYGLIGPEKGLWPTLSAIMSR
jgi:hypothetical protein